MVSDNWSSERGNPPPLISSKGSFICIIPQTGYHIPRPYFFFTPGVKHWLERKIALLVHHEGLIRRSIAPWANSLTAELHLARKKKWKKMNINRSVTLLHCGRRNFVSSFPPLFNFYYFCFYLSKPLVPIDPPPPPPPLYQSRSYSPVISV